MLIKKIKTFDVPISNTIGKAMIITIIGRSKLRKIVRNTIFFNFSLFIGKVSNHSKILPDIIIPVSNIPIKKKLKNWSIKNKPKYKLP